MGRKMLLDARGRYSRRGCGGAGAVVAVMGIMGLWAAPEARGIDVDALKASVPRIIVVLKPDESSLETGSGFVVHTENDYSIVATNHHVIADHVATLPIYVIRKMEDGLDAHQAELIFDDHDRDYALLKVPGLKAPAVPLAPAEPKPGEDLYALGYPGVADERESSQAIRKVLMNGGEGVFADPEGVASGFLEVTVSKGAVRRMLSTHWSHLPTTLVIRIIEHDLNLGHGNSGCPMFDAAGEVVGVHTATKDMGKGLNIDTVKRASYIGELIKDLDSQGISYLKGPGVSAAEGVPAAVVVREERESPWLLPGVLGVAALAVLALVVAVRRRAAIVETYSHFIRRKEAPAMAEAGEETLAQRAAAPLFPSAAGNRDLGVLEGVNQEDGSHIHFTIDDALLRELNERVIIGRSSHKADLCIRNKSVSGEHLSVLRRESQLLVEDRGSSNGTKINGTKLLPYAPVAISDGDRLELGEVVLHFRAKG